MFITGGMPVNDHSTVDDPLPATTDTIDTGQSVGGHTKGIVQLLALTAAGGVAVATDGYVSLPEVQQLTVLLLGGIIVWVVPNTAAGPGAYLKTILATLAAAVSAVPIVVSGGFTVLEGDGYSAWLSALVPVAGVLATYALPNATGAGLAALQGALDDVEREVLDLPAPEEADTTGASLRSPVATDRTPTTSLPVVSATAVPSDLSDALASATSRKRTRR